MMSITDRSGNYLTHYRDLPCHRIDFRWRRPLGLTELECGYEPT